MFSVWGHSTYEKNDDKELMQPQEQPIRRTAAQEKRKKICMYCIKINRERRHWKSYAHKPGHVQNDSGSKKQKKKKKPQDPKRWGAVKRKREREKQPQKLPKLYQTHAAGKYFSKWINKVGKSGKGFGLSSCWIRWQMPEIFLSQLIKNRNKVRRDARRSWLVENSN